MQCKYIFIVPYLLVIESLWLGLFDLNGNFVVITIRNTPGTKLPAMCDICYCAPWPALLDFLGTYYNIIERFTKDKIIACITMQR